MEKKCMICGAELTKYQRKYCAECASRMKKEYRNCVVCGSPLKKGQHKYCDNCKFAAPGYERITADALEKLPDNFSLWQRSAGAAKICLNCPFPAEACSGDCLDSISTAQLKKLARKRKEADANV